MIIGTFDNGRPYVTGDIIIPRLNAIGAVGFLVDTGADVTCIHPKDGTQLLIPFAELNEPIYVGGVGGRTPRYRERALLSFRESVGQPVYRYWVEVRIGKPEDVSDRLPSLLGQDVIHNWRLVHEPAISRVEFYVRTAEILNAGG